MSQTMFPHIAESRMVLAANFRKYGNGPDFWDAYQRLLDAMVPGGEFKAEMANRLALLAQEMGVLETAQLVQV
ncbi:hypothetical protein P6166_05530 [Stenotrophomonas sp. HITSZ_GD]|uniref:hypothetical protein n=1 Tax=Stenotrophomonas sp. HITSZ_GD TaxID=3037248 RepID=UPI00240E17E5|nr:hypothetical protein [Stenotrophomonas sp. HITSZ_GD]MDG2524819.1 hypothetical protein [Stenotrophomonas sp. HITSZ_GD]